MNTSYGWKCYQILNAGEGGRGRDMIVTTAAIAKDAAEQAAEYFDDLEICTERTNVADFDDARQVIEVETNEGPRRFYVRCEVRRIYCAISCDTAGDLAP